MRGAREAKEVPPRVLGVGAGEEAGPDAARRAPRIVAAPPLTVVRARVLTLRPREVGARTDCARGRWVLGLTLRPGGGGCSD